MAIVIGNLLLFQIVYKEVEVKPPLLRGEMMPPGGFTVQSKCKSSQSEINVLNKLATDFMR